MQKVYNNFIFPVGLHVYMQNQNYTLYAVVPMLWVARKWKVKLRYRNKRNDKRFRKIVLISGWMEDVKRYFIFFKSGLFSKL